MSAGINPLQGLESHSGGSSEDQTADSPKQTKSKSGPEILSLARCAACYNHKARSRRDSCDGESSSSAEDSGPELEWESDAESSSSSSSSSGKALSEMHEKPEAEEASPEQDDTAEAKSGGKDGDGGGEMDETSESRDDKTRTKWMNKRAPLVKSYSLPSSFPPQLLPPSLLPRPHTVVSTLQLQVISQKQDNDPFFIVQKHLSEREEEKTEGSYGGWREGINNPLPPQLFRLQKNRLPWQQRSLPSLKQPQPSNQHQQPPPQLSHHHQQPRPQHLSPLSAQGQRFPPPLPSLPVLHPPLLHSQLQSPNSSHTHVHALPPQPCWYCYHMQFPYTYSSY